ncbi:MAG: serine/threonine protein kinase [Deltaproteobacteria bacterium]|nr:serine/threonine protein kinase [Deltaproteobacteria bacterium]MCL5278085.1 serine/threonine protein kinase [Deltaproteobacteria bacterium]
MTVKKISRYEIEKEIGRGAMGVVYLAHDPIINRDVALKTIDIANSLDTARRDELTKRMLVEVRSAGRLNHQNIVTIYDYGEETLPFVVMELVEGESLESLRKKKQKFGVEEVYPIIDGVANGIDYAHSMGVVHRDIKPDNILITKEYVPKITDFGIARMLDASSTQDSAIIGSPSFMSPEQILGGHVDGATDIFSFGIILYYLLAGEKPFAANTPHAVTYKILNEEPRPPSFYNPSLTLHIDGVLLKTLSKDPNERYKKAADVVESLVRAHARKKDRTDPRGEDLTSVKRNVLSEISNVDTIMEEATSNFRRHHFNKKQKR